MGKAIKIITAISLVVGYTVSMLIMRNSTIDFENFVIFGTGFSILTCFVLSVSYNSFKVKERNYVRS
jgi:predicted membrane channel-forming protein YqfA (hemolysin III family)